MVDADCDDGVFCNGEERCVPSSGGGACAPGDAPPCAGACDEEADECEGGCVDGDRDRDGVDSIACGGTDCDDSDPNRFPGNAEVCDANAHDEDCDLETVGFDIDGDGFVGDRCCNEDGAERSCGMDCDDLSRSAYPGAPDICNGADDDCDGDVDEEATLTFYYDGDGDGFGLADDPDLEEAKRPVQACERPDGYALIPGDCNDESAFAQPGGTERCAPAGIDEDCDGNIDEFGPDTDSPAVDLVTYYRDADADGWGNTDDVRIACAPPGGYVPFPGDCRDDRRGVNPGRTFAFEPDCPRGAMVGGARQVVDARICSGRWQCVVESQGCSGILTNAQLRPVWDLNCDGEVRQWGGSCDATCSFFDTGERLIGSPDTTCGFGSIYYLPPITACTMSAGECLTVAAGGPGGRPCR